MRVAVFIITILLSLLPFVVSAQQHREDELRQLQKLNRFYHYLNVTYVDSLQMGPLVESAIRSMLSELDPHSTYLDKEEMKAQQESVDGAFSGVGVEYNILNDTLLVVGTVANGPAEKVGVVANDRIVEIDGENVVGIKRSDVPSKLRGQSGSQVEIAVVRRGVKEPLRFNITRDKIPIETIDAAFLAAPKVGYVKVNRFGRTTMTEFRSAVESLGEIESLILDLSSNGGGLFDQAIEMAGYFLPKESLVVSNEGRMIEPQYYRTTTECVFNGRVAVIINGSSASSSEIVAGALQDWDRAVIVGQNSFGKGLVQRQVPLGDGSAVRITVARYHTPTGRAIQRPYEKGEREKYYKNRLTSDQTDSLGMDSLSQARPTYKTLLHGRKVYGGGGITPDVVVKIDTTQISNYMVNIVAQGVYNDFILEYLDRQREKLKSKYPTFEKFESEFNLSDQEMNRLTQLATEKGVKYDEEGYLKSQKLMRNQLSAMIAQRLFSTSEFYRLLNPRQNDNYQRALELLLDWDKEGKHYLLPPKQ